MVTTGGTKQSPASVGAEDLRKLIAQTRADLGQLLPHVTDKVLYQRLCRIMRPVDIFFEKHKLSCST